MEHLNKFCKGQAGISGITSNNKTLQKFCLIAPEFARLTEEMVQLVAVSDKTLTKLHHSLSNAKVPSQERAIKSLKSVLAKCHLFSKEDIQENASVADYMFKLISKEILLQNVREGILSNRKGGQGSLWRVCERTHSWREEPLGPHVQSESTDMEFICKSYLGEVWLTSHHTEATSSLFARILMVARSSREDIDLL